MEQPSGAVLSLQRWLASRRSLLPVSRLLALLSLLAGLLAPVTVRADHDGPPGEVFPEERVVEPLLPDLRTAPPADLTVEFASRGRRLLRLANMVWNSGQGPLE